MNEGKINVLADPSAVAQAAAELFVQSSHEAIARQGKFSVALSGGTTPRALYALLAADPFINAVDWSNTFIFFADERCVPPDDPQSNYGMVRETLLNHLQIPSTNIHRMKGEIDPQSAAMEYGKMLKQTFGDGGMDLTLLGMGDDGHTASLFPHTSALAEKSHRCVANFVDKLNTWRLTLSAPFINHSHAVALLVCGPSKAATIQRVMEEPPSPQQFPIQLIQPQSNNLLWLLDVAAAGM
ncbi:MAG: 6-phosphogluconolactonase [Phycisphaerales bacterium]|jgi:6-phosphogluconolactonase|nr:6-phosphogluconolactonase [Phycisphaerales bacterium]